MAMTTSAPVPTTDKPPRLRRWIPVSLRMFVAMLLFSGIGSALWIGIPAYRQQVAIRHLRGFGVQIRPDVSHIGPNWFRRWIGEERLRALGRVQNLNLSDLNFSDADVAYLQGLNGLEWLALNRNPITDEGMQNLDAIITLKALRVEDTRVTDTGLVYLKGLKHLEVLSLKRTGVTGSGLKHLKGLPSLRHLDLEDNWIDDTALAILSDLTGIRELRLGGTRISDAGVAELERSLPLLTTETAWLRSPRRATIR